MLAASGSSQAVGLRASAPGGEPLPTRGRPRFLAPWASQCGSLLNGSRLGRASVEESAGQTEVAVLCNVTTIVTFHHLCRVLPLRALLLTLKARGFHEDADNRCVCGEGVRFRVHQSQGVMSNVPCFPFYVYQLHQLVIKLLIQDRRKVYNLKIYVFENSNGDVYLILVFKM